MTCTKCENKVDEYRYHLGYTECTDCSDTEKYSAHVVYPHKTGAFVQPVSNTASKNLKRMDRRSVSGNRVAKGIYADNSWDRWLQDFQDGKFKPKKPIGPKGKPLKNKSRPYQMVIWTCIDYYKNHGYEPTLDFVKELYREDKITLMTKTKIVNEITSLHIIPTKLRKKII